VFRPFFVRSASPSDEKAYDLPESARNLVLRTHPVNPSTAVFLKVWSEKERIGNAAPA